MTSITLEYIKAEQSKLAEMIATFEKQAATTAAFHFPEFTIELAQGEHYAGLIIGKDGDPSHHLILLPGQANSINWKDAQAWANDQGGELPTRCEQSLLYANLKDQFDKDWYWSAETHESDSALAWYQFFYHGRQGSSHKGLSLCRARAVRRLVIKEPR